MSQLIKSTKKAKLLLFNLLTNSIFAPNYIDIQCRKKVIKKVASYAKGTLLDVGCGEKPYQSYFSPYIDKYIGLDLNPETTKRPILFSSVDVFGDVNALPFNSDFFDTLINIGVLEHLNEPKPALKEMYRVLKNKGILIMLVPEVFRIHMKPDDYWRFTEFGLQYLVKDAGFKIVESHSVGGNWKVIGQAIAWQLFTTTRRNNSLLRKLLLSVAILPIAIIQIVFCFLHWVNPKYDYSILQLVVAEKKES